MMKWIILTGFLVCLARSGAGGALKCTSGVEDPLCRKDKEDLDKTTQVEGKECAPDTHWKSKCNDCACSPEGHPYCTEKACPGYELESEKECAPGSNWKRECNSCWCTPGGLALCTKIGCVSIPANQHFNDESSEKKPDVAQNFLYEDPHILFKRSVCEPNQNFQSDCNTCKCSSDGHTYSCTDNECMDTGVDKDVDVFMDNEGVDHIERNSVCKPRTIFYVGCNSCKCNSDGTNYSCTNKLCPLPKDVELFHELKAVRSSINKTKAVVCVANRMFIRDCNTCWCNEDGTGYFCTRKVCVPELPEEPDTDEHKPEQKLRIIKQECRPDEVFEMDCNMCRCNPDGKSFSCTRRACLEQVDEDKKKETLSRKTRGLPQANTQSTPKACEPGKVFRMDCNQCLCDNEGQDFSCTRIDCIALNNINNGGTRTKRDNEFDASDSSFRCNPGEQYKRGCKDCTCSADGKSIFCSVRLCDKDLAHVID